MTASTSSQHVPRPTVQLTLDAEAVAAPAHAAAVVCRELVDFCFGAFDQADLSKRPTVQQNGHFFRFDVKGPDLTAPARREMYENWILAKAFQDLMRGVRASLEQAYLVSEIVSRTHSIKSNGTLDDFLAPFLKEAADKNFPQLLKDVNSRLSKPLEFSTSYQSMQNARNCLEHRGGIVGRTDLRGADEMELNFPRIKIFYERHGQEVEVQPDTPVDADDGRPDVQILMRLDTRKRSLKLGDRIAFTNAGFDEIIFACYYFGSQLAALLPRSSGDSAFPNVTGSTHNGPA